MELSLLYIGPGLGLGSILIVLVVLLIIIGSMVMIIWTPIKNFFKKIKTRKKSEQEIK